MSKSGGWPPNNIRIIIERANVPIIVDAGVGTASDVSQAMELGAGGVLLNTGIAAAKDPVRMTRAMRAACAAGRDAWLAGRWRSGLRVRVVAHRRHDRGKADGASDLSPTSTDSVGRIETKWPRPRHPVVRSAVRGVIF